MIKEVVNKTAEIERRFDGKIANRILEQGAKIVMGDAKHVVIEKQHLSGDKIKDAIGFVPEISFDEGLEKTILFYRDYFKNCNKDTGVRRQNAGARRQYQ